MKVTKHSLVAVFTSLVVLSQVPVAANAYEAPEWAQKGTVYARFGGGASAKSPYINDNYEEVGSGLPVEHYKAYLSGGAGLFSTEVGYNHYAGSHFYIGVGTSLDIRFNDSYGSDYAVNFGDTKISGFFVDLKLKLGAHFDVMDCRLTGYGVVGLGINVTNRADAGGVSNIDGPEVGLGFMVTSKIYPVGVYIEATVPVLIYNQTIHGHKEIARDTGFIVAPKFSAGIQIGY